MFKVGSRDQIITCLPKWMRWSVEGITVFTAICNNIRPFFWR